MQKQLIHEQIEQFWEQGWIHLGAVMTAPTIEALRAEEARFRQYPLYLDKDHPEARTVFRSHMSAYSQVIRDFGLKGGHIPAVLKLLGPNVIWFYTQFVTKFPDGDTGKSEFPWHQDFGYGPIHPPQGLSVWVALDDVDESNGCVWVLPESHKKGYVQHDQVASDHWYMNASVKGSGVPARLKAGEAVAFTGLTLHRSLLNKTDKPRRGFFMEYVDANCRDSEGTPIVDLPRAYLVAGQANVEARGGWEDKVLANVVSRVRPPGSDGATPQL